MSGEIILVIISISVLFAAGLSWFKASRHSKEIKKGVRSARAQLEAYPLLQEDDFAEKTLYWNEICLDTTRYALSIIKTLRELEELEDKGEVNSLFCDSDNGRQIPERTEKILTIFYDGFSGAFRQTRVGKYSVYSIEDAFNIIEKHTIRSKETKLMASKFRKVKDYVFECYHEKDGFFSPYRENSPSSSSLSSTFSALLSLHQMENLYEEEILNKVDMDGIRKYVSLCEKRLDNIVAFSDKLSGEPIISSTFLALLIYTCTVLRDMPSLQNLMKDKGIGIVGFIKACWVENDGGYTWTPNYEATLIHTRYALLVMRFLMHYRLVDIEIISNHLKPDKIINFVNSCKSYNGFGFVKNHSPSVYSTRAAVKIIKYLELFNKYGVFKADERYKKEVQEFKKGKKETQKFLDSCYDAKSGGYLGFMAGE